ncbi:MAG: DUF6580 family putative transport protein [Patescibacteria group bacterium]
MTRRVSSAFVPLGGTSADSVLPKNLNIPRMEARGASFTTVMVVGLVVLGAVIRVVRDAGWLPLPPNVAPISAMALFSGAYLPRRWTFVVPLSAMLASDLIIGFYTLPVMVAVYASFASSNLFGRQLRQRLAVRRLLMFSLAGSIVFFLVTNAAVWAFQSMYPHTGAGLMQAYAAGLPFFRNTVLGDLGFVGLFFGLYRAVVVYLTWRQALATSTTHG